MCLISSTQPMSAEAVRGFLEAIKTDVTLQDKLKMVVEAENADEAIVAIGNKAGFEFSAEEWLDEQLDTINGGAYWSPVTGGAWLMTS